MPILELEDLNLDLKRYIIRILLVTRLLRIIGVIIVGDQQEDAGSR